MFAVAWCLGVGIKTHQAAVLDIMVKQISGLVKTMKSYGEAWTQNDMVRAGSRTAVGCAGDLVKCAFLLDEKCDFVSVMSTKALWVEPKKAGPVVHGVQTVMEKLQQSMEELSQAVLHTEISPKIEGAGLLEKVQTMFAASDPTKAFVKVFIESLAIRLDICKIHGFHVAASSALGIDTMHGPLNSLCELWNKIKDSDLCKQDIDKLPNQAITKHAPMHA